MLIKSQFNKTLLSCCARIGVVLCLAMCCSIAIYAQCNSQYDIDFSNSLGTSNGTLLDNGTAVPLPENLGAGSTCNCDDGNPAGSNCFEMEIVNTGMTSCATVELDASNGYLVDPTADCSTIDEDNTSVNIDLTQSTTVLVCKSSGGNLTVQRLRAMPCMEDCELVVTCPPDMATISCDDENDTDLFGLIGGAIDSTATAPCGDVVITSDFLFPGICGGNYLTTFTISDSITTTTCVSNISVEPRSAPVITSCPPDMEISCVSDAVADTTQFEFTTDCGGENVFVSDVQILDGNSACGETPGDRYFITYTVNDDCGSSTSSCTQTFTIVGPKPVITACPPDRTISCTLEIAADISALQAEGCGLELTVVADEILFDPNNSECGESTGDKYMIRYSVSDECGNLNECLQTFTIAAPTPVVTCPADVTGLSCDADLPAPETTLSGTNNCNLTTQFTVINVEDSGSVPAIFCAGDSEIIIRRTYTVEDACGNQAQCVQSFTFVSDSEPPQIQCLANVTGIVCGDTISAAETMLPGTDNCDPATEFAVIDVVDSEYPASFCEVSDVITIVRRYTVVDACGNAAICTQFFEFEPDAEGPMVSCPDEVVLTCGDALPAAETMLSGTDNCDTATEFVVTNVVDSDLPTSFCGGSDLVISRRYTVVDACGNETQCSQNFRFEEDTQGPTINCPANVTGLVCGDTLPATETTLFGTDNCDPATEFAVTNVMDSNLPDFCESSNLVVVRTYTVEDNCGNEGQCIQTFTFNPNTEEPTITCPAGGIVECAEDISVDADDVSFTTSCGLGATVSIVGPIPDGTFDCPGTTYTYTYTVEDACGRTASCDRVFTVANDEPTITCPTSFAIECVSDLPPTGGEPPIFTTSCSLLPSVRGRPNDPLVNGIPNCPGTTYSYFFRIEDACGRVDSCEQVFTVVNDGPMITSCPEDSFVNCPADIRPGTPEFTTSCGVGGTISVIGPVIDGNMYTYTHIVTDACGRTTSCEQVFTVQNTILTITCPEDCPVVCPSDIRPGTPEFTTGCGGSGTVNVTGPVIDGDLGCDGTTYTYTHTVTDAQGTTASCEQVFTIVNECHLIDFDFDDAGNPLHPGTDIFDQYEDFTVTTDNPHRCVQLFDTENPTSNDFDLGTPNQQYGGPGIGAGGVNNTEFQGNALIVSYDCGVPNEKEGQLIFTFDCSVTIKTVDLLDMKCGHSEIELYDEHHNLIEELPIPGYGVNSFNTFDVNVSGVYTMIIDLDCGGGVTAFKYCKDNTPGANCEANDLCENYNLDFDNSGYHWTTNSTSGSFDVGDQNYTISIADDDGILEDTYENSGGLLIGIDPHDVHDEVVICYNLSQASDNVSFDIFDLDYKNYQNSSRQQEAVCVYGLFGDELTQIMPLITSLDGSVDIDGNCAEATRNSAVSGEDESILVEFSECIDKVVIVYGTGSNSPTHNPSYSKITIGERIGFNSEVCPGECILAECSSAGPGLGGDDDNDGVCNNEDVCPGGNDNIDSDGDGIPDDCDDICYDYNIDHSSCGAGWQHGDESGTVELGLENISIDILDDDNILENTQADGTGLFVGIEPQTVDDELVICYTLSESSANVVFDITDLDYKNGGSKQQEAVCIYGTLGSNPTQILPTVTSLDGSVDIDGNCAEGTVNSAHSHDDESILVEFTECIDKITIVYGTGSNSPTHNPDYSGIVIGESIFSVEQCKDGCNEPCPIVDTGGGPMGDGDADDDGVCDGNDICPGGDDFMDTDGDGTPDFCDNDCISLGDDDGDFVCNGSDQCPGFDDNIDENNNGIPDGCDVECEDYTLDFAEHGYDWSGHNLVESYTVGNQMFDVRIIDGDHILTSSHDRDSGLAIGTNPHDVNDEVVLCYSLSQVASNVRFDIVDLDYKTGGSKQQEAVCVYGTLGADPTQIMPNITSLEGSVAISGNCAEATANSSASGQDESILVEFTECIDKVTIVYGTGSNSPTGNPDHGKITIGQNLGFVTEVCTNTCLELREEDEENAYISLYPNPVYGSGNVTVEIDTEIRGDAQVVLIDALGRIISTENIELTNNITTHELSTNQLAAGVYFVQLHTQEWRTDGMKLVVVKP